MAWVTPTSVSTGSVLTASRYNQDVVDNTKALALRHIKTQTIGSGVSSVDVTGVFSADYDNYLVTVTNVDHSGTNNDFFIRLGTSTTRTEYQYGNIATTTAGVVSAGGAANSANGMSVGYTEDDEWNGVITVMAPFLAQPSTVHSTIANQQYFGVATGWDGLASSHTQFTLRVGTGTMTGGEIRVYGYINAS